MPEHQVPGGGKVGGSRFGNHGRIGGGGLALWRCPTCAAENPGTIDDGCQNPECPTVLARPGKGETPPQTVGAMMILPGGAMAEAYDRWREENQGRAVNARAAFEAGWIAGIHWSTIQAKMAATDLPRQGGTPPPPPAPPEAPVKQEKAVLIIDRGETHAIIDTRTRDTILAALRFYVENDLNYGSKPGQLDAHEVKDLVAALEPDEEEL